MDIYLKELRGSTSASKQNITELKGLGKEIWEDVDAQEYVDRERNSWE